MATSNSNLLQPKIEVNLFPDDGLSLGPFQQLETQLLEAMEIPEQHPPHSLKLEDAPPPVVEDQPIINVPTVGRSSIAKNVPNAPTQKRGLYKRSKHGDIIRKYMKGNGKIPIQFREKDGRPVGKYAVVFKTELGVAVKEFVPLQVSGWRNVTEEHKQHVFDWLESGFTVEFGIAPSLVKKATENMMSRRYRDYRQKMHEHYKALTHLPWEDRLKHVPKEFCKNEADWEFMCKMFESETFKKASAINSGNRSKTKRTYVYRGGSKSLSQYEYDNDDGSEEKDEIAVSNVTNNSGKGCPGESAERVDFNDEQIGLDNQDDGSQSLEEVDVDEQAREQVQEIRVGYEPAKPDATSLIAELRKELASTQNELHGTQSALQLAEERIRALEVNQRMMKQAFERLASDIVI